jgi:hypothetical protein
MISSDLPEILGVTDRLLVLHDGRRVATLTTPESTPDEVLNCAADLATSVKGGARMADQKLDQTREKP